MAEPLTSTGFIAKTLTDVLGEIEADLLAAVHTELDTSPDQPIGQIAGVFAKPNAEVWELLQVVIDSWDPSNAEGALLEAICAITGTKRIGQKKSTLPVACALVIGTPLTTTAMVQVDGDSTNRWTLRENFTAPSSGTFTLVFESERFGAVEALNGTVNTIVTPVTGWTSAHNTADATLGNTTEKDPALRVRRVTELRAQGASTLPALEAALEPSTVPGIIASLVLVNDKSTPDIGLGLPPNSFEAIIWDGETPQASDDTIRKTIWKHKPMGIQAIGSTIGSFIDAKGRTWTVPFSRAAKKRIVIDITVVKNGLFPTDGANQIKLAIIGDEVNYVMDMDVVRLQIQALAKTVKGVVDVPSCILSIFSETSPAEANVPIPPRAIATFDTADITVHVT